MEPTILRQLIRIWDRQGFFHGDLNVVQQFCLTQVMSEELQTDFNTLKISTLAANPQVYKTIFEDILVEEGPQWIVPRDDDDYEDVLAEIEAWQASKEVFTGEQARE